MQPELKKRRKEKPKREDPLLNDMPTQLFYHVENGMLFFAENVALKFCSRQIFVSETLKMSVNVNFVCETFNPLTGFFQTNAKISIFRHTLFEALLVSVPLTSQRSMGWADNCRRVSGRISFIQS